MRRFPLALLLAVGLGCGPEPPPPPAAPPPEGAAIDAAPTRPRPADPTPKEPVGPVPRIEWEQLASYTFDATRTDLDVLRTEIPAEITALDGRVIDVEGHMIPLRVDDQTGLVREFVLSRWLTGCCFGGDAKITEWVIVRVPPERRIPSAPNATVIVRGRLAVGPDLDPEIEMIRCVYRMRARSVTVIRR